MWPLLLIILGRERAAKSGLRFDTNKITFSCDPRFPLARACGEPLIKIKAPLIQAAFTSWKLFEWE
jgi:hypothetical protein